MLNDIKEYYRFKLYENCRILVNNLKEPIDEIIMFLEKKIYPFLKENCDYERIVVEGIEIMSEGDKIIWRIVENNELNSISTKWLDLNNITEVFEDKEEYLSEVKEKLETFPKELYGVSFVSFMEALSHFIFSEELIGDVVNVFDICMIADNGVNNVVYELQ